MSKSLLHKYPLLESKTTISITMMNQNYNDLLVSSREKQVLDLILNELTTKEIASKLYISTETVTSHRKNIMQKLNARNTAGLVRRAIESGVVRLNLN